MLFMVRDRRRGVAAPSSLSLSDASSGGAIGSEGELGVELGAARAGMLKVFRRRKSGKSLFRRFSGIVSSSSEQAGEMASRLTWAVAADTATSWRYKTPPAPSWSTPDDGRDDDR